MAPLELGSELARESFPTPWWRPGTGFQWRVLESSDGGHGRV